MQTRHAGYPLGLVYPTATVSLTTTEWRAKSITPVLLSFRVENVQEMGAALQNRPRIDYRIRARRCLLGCKKQRMIPIGVLLSFAIFSVVNSYTQLQECWEFASLNFIRHTRSVFQRCIREGAVSPDPAASDFFRIGLTRDFLTSDGTIAFGEIGLDTLDVPGVRWEFLTENTPELRPDQIAGYEGLLVLGPKVTANTLRGNDRLVVLARFGVGYDNVDVTACTDAGVALTITPDGVRRPVAVSAITFLLACSHKLLIKDKLTREGRWADKLHHMGQGVTGRILGVIGVGNIGREIFRLAEPFQMKHLGYDPYLTTAPDGIELVPLDRLLREADYVIICCALSDQTRYLIHSDRLRLMKPTAYLINVARGPIVDQAALTAALQNRWIAGAGLDVFDPEPIDPNDPLLKLDNVILAPHAICWTDECFGNNGRSACRSLLATAKGRPPEVAHVVNPAVLTSPRFLAKLSRFAKGTP